MKNLTPMRIFLIIISAIFLLIIIFSPVLLLLILTFIALCILGGLCAKKGFLSVEALIPLLFFFGFAFATLMIVFGTYSTCADGWTSLSIGHRGACSWHGGITQRFNVFGWSVLGIDILIIVCWLIYMISNQKNDKDQK